MFDEQNLVSQAVLVPVLELAEQTGLSRLIGEHLALPSTRVKSGAVNPAGKLTSIIAAMTCGADSIDVGNVLRAGGTPRVFNEVYAPSTLGIFLREFTFGHANQLAAVARAHLVALAARTPLLPGIEQRAFIDIDSLLRTVYGHHKRGASFGHAKIASRALLRLGLSPQITTISTAQAAPVIAEARLRSGKAASGRAAAAQLKQAIGTARACRAGTILVRGDSAFGAKKVISTCVAEGAELFLSVSRNKRISAAIEAIDEAAYTPVHYPGAVTDPDTGALISDAEVAETPYTMRLGSGRTLIVRPVVRRVKDARYPDALFPVWRHHPFVANSELPTAEADITKSPPGRAGRPCALHARDVAVLGRGRQKARYCREFHSLPAQISGVFSAADLCPSRSYRGTRVDSPTFRRRQPAKYCHRVNCFSWVRDNAGVGLQ